MTETKDWVSLETCYYCGEDKGVVLDTRMQATLPRKAVYNKEPCGVCAGHMEAGVMLIEVRDGEQGDNPYRTGRLSVLTEEAIRRIFSGDVVETLATRRVGFIPRSASEMIGLFAEEEA